MAGDNKKIVKELKQDLLGFVSQLANTVKNHADRFDVMAARYDQLFQKDYKKCASLKISETKKVMSGIPATVDSRDAKALDQTLDNANKQNQEPDLKTTPKNTRPSR